MSEKESANRFDMLAANWDENPVRIQMVRAVATKMIETVRPDGSMNTLEFGCGTGLVTVLIAPEVRHITAMDSSEKMLSELQKKIEEMKLINISCLKGDLVSETLKDSSFDFIYSNMTYHHIHDGAALLNKLHKALSVNGRLVIADLDLEDGSFHTDMAGVHHPGFLRSDVVSAFERAGFSHCAIMDAHTIEKKEENGKVRRYSMFLAFGTKEA